MSRARWRIKEPETEHQIQCAAIRRLRNEEAIERPNVARIYSIPNGGKRTGAGAVQLKNSGQRAGMPDLHYPPARGGYFSLYIEVKKPGEDPQPHQVEIHEELRADGHAVFVADTPDQIVELVINYDDLPPTLVAGAAGVEPAKTRVGISSPSDGAPMAPTQGIEPQLPE